MPERAAMIGTLERILYLKKLPVFARLPTTALAALADYMRERSFPRGSVLQNEGMAVLKIQLVVDGLIAVMRGGVKLSDAGPGTPLGSLPVLARDTQGFLGVAQLDTFTLELDSEALIEVCEDHFVIVHQMLQYLSRWVIEIEKQIGPQLAAESPVPFTRLRGGELDLVERIFFLRRLAPFARASINTLAELSRGLTEVHFDAGVELWVEGDASPYVLLIVDGRIACASKQHGHRFAMGRGQAVGVMESMAELPRWFEATTETPVVALHGAVEGLIDVFEDNFEMGMDYAALLARGILSFIDRAGLSGHVPAPPP
jgi:CRP/FNR family cyclic AMP-dependent transcriptional regulator